MEVVLREALVQGRMRRAGLGSGGPPWHQPDLRLWSLSAQEPPGSLARMPRLWTVWAKRCSQRPSNTPTRPDRAFGTERRGCRLMRVPRSHRLEGGGVITSFRPVELVT